MGLCDDIFLAANGEPGSHDNQHTTSHADLDIGRQPTGSNVEVTRDKLVLSAQTVNSLLLSYELVLCHL
jgi:hypothetical protein